MSTELLLNGIKSDQYHEHGNHVGNQKVSDLMNINQHVSKGKGTGNESVHSVK